MSAIVLSRIERGVSSKVRQRAAPYAHEGAVTLEKRSTLDEPIVATVLGTSLYSVVLRYDDRALSDRAPVRISSTASRSASTSGRRSSPARRRR